jgi:hypothetical protein
VRARVDRVQRGGGGERLPAVELVEPERQVGEAHDSKIAEISPASVFV